MPFYLSPGVYSQELDLSQRVRAAASSVGAIVFESKRGPLEPRYITDRQQFLELYGYPDPSVGFGHDCAINFLEESNQLWVKRVINGALWAGTTYYQDDSTDPTRTLKLDFVEGEDNNHEQGGRQFQLIKINQAIASGEDIQLDISDGNNTNTVGPTSFSTDSNTTLANLASAIQTELDNLKSGGLAQVYDESPGGTDDDRIITIVSPSDTEITISNIQVTTSAGLDVTNHTDVKLFDIFADNPGSWANDVGVQLTSIDTGVSQKLKVIFDSALVSSNEIDLKVNGYAISTVTFNSDNDTTLSNLATEIENTINNNIASGASVKVIEVPNGTDNDREVEITAPNSRTELEITDAVVTNGASQPNISVEESLNRIPPDNTFVLEVFSRSNINFPQETYTVSLVEQQDGNGIQQNIAQQINEGATASYYIKVYQPDYTLNTTNSIPDYALQTEDTSINWLEGGDDGNTVNFSDISDGWDSFSNREEYDIRILINGGYTGQSVQRKIKNLAESRKDCIAVLDMPSDVQKTQDAVNYRKFELNINSSYAALYSPDPKIVDEFTDIIRFIPPSGKVAATYARTDRLREPWFSPAGLNRGQINQIRGLRYNYDQGQRDLLSPNQVNAIISKPGRGIVVWDDNTLQAKSSSLSYINVRRLLIQLEVALTDALDYSVFEPNDPFTRFQIVQMLNGFLEPIRNNRGLYDYLVVCDETNNPPNVIDRSRLNVDVYVKPSIPARKIRLRTIITRTGANFEELVGNV